MATKKWEEVYGKPATALAPMFRAAVTHERLMARVVDKARVLEVGTGTARLSAFVSRFCGLAVSLDSSIAVLESAKEARRHLGPRLRLIAGDGFRLPFADDSFDACFSQGLLEHFSDHDIALLVSEQLRVAGHVHASVPSFFYPRIGSLGPGLVGNERFLTLRRWRRVLAAHSVRGEYYPDFKLAMVAGRTLPWPIHLLLDITRRQT